MAQWIERPSRVQEVTGLIPVRDADYFPLSHAYAMLSLCHMSMSNVIDNLHVDGII